jgi:uncharacterized integral membrane protein
VRLGKREQTPDGPAAEGATQGAAAGTTAPAKRAWLRRGGGGEDTFQARLWLTIGSLLLAFAYVVAFVIANSDTVKISFVFFSARSSLVWLVLLSLVIGLVGGILLSQLVRRRGRRQ